MFDSYQGRAGQGRAGQRLFTSTTEPKCALARLRYVGTDTQREGAREGGREREREQSFVLARSLQVF